MVLCIQVNKMYVIATLSVYPHRASLKNMPGHGGIRTYDLWNASPMLCQLSYAVRSVRVYDISELSLVNIIHSNRPDRVAQLAEHWASIPKVVGSNPTVARHIFQACPVWIYTQSSNYIHLGIFVAMYSILVILIAMSIVEIQARGQLFEIKRWIGQI